ncbi:hypothetical protein G6F37_013211 [Rhizopus arrhizus]|nr:hypothetical protein G6F37_013211 [Rhizopus arrhizus]
MVHGITISSLIPIGTSYINPRPVCFDPFPRVKMLSDAESISNPRASAKAFDIHVFAAPLSTKALMFLSPMLTVEYTAVTEDGSEVTPKINANAHEITSDHDDIDAEVSKLIRYKKEESARLYQKHIMAGEEEQADLAFKKMRKYGAQLLALSGKLVSPVITPVKKEIGLRLTQNDIPKFQLSSWPDIPFPGEKCYESVEHFLRSFEKVIYSAALDIQEVWRRYLPVSLAFDHDDWIEKELKRCDTWNTARIVFTNKFLTDNARTDAMHRLFTMTMNKNESVSSC